MNHQLGTLAALTALLAAALPARAANPNDQYGEVNLERLHGHDAVVEVDGKKLLKDRAQASKVPWVGSWWAYSRNGIDHAFAGGDSPALKLDKWKGRADKIESDKLVTILQEVRSTWDAKAAEQAAALREVYAEIAKGNNAWRDTEVGKKYTRLTTELDAAKRELKGRVKVDTAVEFERLEHGNGTFGVQGWWGHCNAWSAAAIMDPEPRKPATVDGIEWRVGDVKAALTEAWMEHNSSFFGTRNKDTRNHGSVDFKDVTPAAYHIFFADQLGNKDKSFVIDRFTGEEVWNQPVRAYQAKLEPLYRIENGTAVAEDRDVKITRYSGSDGREESLGVKKVYPVLVTSSMQWMSDGVPHEALTSARINEPESEEEFASSSTIHRKFDEQVEVRTLTYELWLDRPIGDPAAQIIGDGAWKHADPTSEHNHPDFLWQPLSQTPSRRDYENPHVPYEEIVARILPGMVESLGGGGGGVSQPVRADLTFPATAGLGEIPDNSAAGLVSVLDVPADVIIAAVVLTPDIAHSYRGDLQLVLEHGGKSVTVKEFGEGGDADHLREPITVAGFDGERSRGPWTLRVVDNAAQDTGRLDGWTLAFAQLPENGPAAVELTFTASSGLGTIPDNTTGGLTSELVVGTDVPVVSIVVFPDVTHSYKGDLKLVLRNGRRSKTIKKFGDGGSDDDVKGPIEVHHFEGLSTKGTWKLQVVDNSAQDVGTLNGWKIQFNP